MALLGVGTRHVVVATTVERNQWAAAEFGRFLDQQVLNDSSDVSIYCEDIDEPVHAHASILAARSPYLKGLIRQAMISQGGKCIRIDLLTPG